MSRNAKIMSIASEEALNSRQTFRHGAVITGPVVKLYRLDIIKVIEQKF